VNEKSGDDELAFDQDDAMVRRAAQRYGTVGAMLAGGMLVFDKLLGRKPKEEAAVVIEAASEPGNIDDNGIDACCRCQHNGRFTPATPPSARLQHQSARSDKATKTQPQ